MATDLNAPLGQNRKESPARKRDLGRVLRYCGLGLGALAVIGISAWSALSPGHQTRSPAMPAATEATLATEPAPSSEGQGNGPGALHRSGALSGAHVEDVLTDDGATVRKYTPRSRETGGPALIDVEATRGQDPPHGSPSE